MTARSSAATGRTLVYLSYGAGPQTDEAVYALLSAHRARRGDARTGLLLYTDQPRAFTGLPVEVREVSAAELDDWAGPDGYLHRRKTQVLRDALARQGHPIAFVDSDTWFRRPAAELFARVGPGAVALHLREGRLLDSNSPAKHALSAHVAGRTFAGAGAGAGGQPLVLEPNATMWNSGVVGIDPADAPLLDAALSLVDQVWAGYRGSHDVEQFALGQVLERSVRVTESADVVYHYWPAPVRDPWRARLPGLLADTAGLPVDERAEVLHRHRPRPAGVAALRFAAKQVYRSTGRATPGVRSSCT